MIGTIVLGVLAGLIVVASIFGFVKQSRKRSRDSQRGWGVRHHGRDQLYYEEFNGTEWLRIAVDGEMLNGTPRHVIYFRDPVKWLEYPEWARFRRNEIISRIKSECPRPEYDHDGA